MLVSKYKFYQEVTGLKSGNQSTLTNALKRWGIPFLETPGATDCVDIIHIAKAKEAYAAELAAAPPDSPVRKAELLQLVATRLATLEEQVNKVVQEMVKFQNTQIGWNGKFGTRLDILQAAAKKRR